MIRAMMQGRAWYGIFGNEVAPTTGTEHLQAYIYSKSPVRFRTIKDMFPGAHIEKAKGNPVQNVAYCSKEGDFFEVGREHKPVSAAGTSQQGKRNDLQNLFDLAKGGAVTGTAIDAGHIRSGAALRAYGRLQALVRAPRRDDVRVGWFYGHSGAGKTRAAHEILGDEAYTMANDRGWWDGYDGQRCVIIDDFNPEGLRPSELLRILDRYPYIVGGKGYNTPFRGTRIIVTSCLHPRDLMGDRWGEALRRLSSTNLGRASSDGAYIYEFNTPDIGQAWKSTPVVDATYFKAPAEVPLPEASVPEGAEDEEECEDEA